jgi:hypothetical protein
MCKMANQAPFVQPLATGHCKRFLRIKLYKELCVDEWRCKVRSKFDHPAEHEKSSNP